MSVRRGASFVAMLAFGAAPAAAQVRVGVGPLVIAATPGRHGVDVRVEPRVEPRARSTARALPARVLATADRYVGTRYTWGGDTPAEGFDCSGFVQYVFARHGVELPRVSRQQARVGLAVSRSTAALRPGDLLLFASSGTRIDHVAIYAGGNRIIHSSSSGGGVRYDDLGSARGRWFVRHHVASRRVVADGAPLVRELTEALRAWASPDPPDRAPRP